MVTRNRTATGGASATGGGISRDLDSARQAFDAGNAELSRRAHDAGGQAQSSAAPVCEPGHQGLDTSLQRCFAYGALEGLLSSLVLLACGVGLDLPTSQLQRLVVGGLTGLSCGAAARTYARYRMSSETFTREKARERWELQNYPQGEMSEMEELYTARGISPQDAKTAVSTIARYPDFFVDVMMVQELGLPIPDAKPLHNAACALAGFGAAAAAPAAALLLGLPSFALSNPPGSTLRELFAAIFTLKLSATEAWGAGGLRALGHPLALLALFLALVGMELLLGIRHAMGSVGRKGTHWVPGFLLLGVATSTGVAAWLSAQ